MYRLTIVSRRAAESPATTVIRTWRNESEAWRLTFDKVVPVRNEGPAPGLQPGIGLDRDASSEDNTWRLSGEMSVSGRKIGGRPRRKRMCRKGPLACGFSIMIQASVGRGAA